MTVSLFPFAEAMRFGFGVLHMSPDAFWRMTPRELRAAASAYRPAQRAAAPSQADLQHLMRLFPDHPATKGHADANAIS